jgi:outer membrane protein OmpA-like peptidoglycan-associated protein
VDVEATYFPYRKAIDNETYKGDYAEEMKKLVEERLKQEEDQLRAQATTNRDPNAGFIVDQSGGEGQEELVYLVYFGGKSDRLNSRSKEELDKAVSQIQSSNANSVIVNGHTDRSFEANQSLITSKARADAVRNYLIAQGVNENIIRSFGFGMTDNAVPNEPGEKNPANNRVEVIFSAPATAE